MDVFIVLVGGLGVVVAALSERVRHLPVSEPLLALVVGVLVGPAGLAVLDLPTLVEEPEPMHDAARGLLAVSVMAVALRYPVRALRPVIGPVAILVLVGMPGMALLTAGVTAAVVGGGLATAVLVGAAACPTDPVLASSTVTGGPAERILPERERRILSIESGANDGLALPLVLVALAVVGGGTVTDALVESAVQVGGALLLGLVAGLLGAQALTFGEEHGATEPAPRLLFTVLLALVVLGGSGLLRVDGILAVFVAGLVFNARSTGSDRTESASIDEAVNRFLVLPLFLLLGATLPWSEWAALGWRGPALVLAVLLLRRLPLLLVLRRPLRLGWPGAAYVGWFGPVGVSALLYLTLEAERLGVRTEVLAAGSIVVAGSTVAHGLTSSAGLALYERARSTRRDEATSGRGS